MSRERLSREARTLRERAGLVELGVRAKVEVAGPDGLGFLDRLLSQNVSGLVPGAGARALLLDRKGHITADLRVLVLEGRVLLDGEPGRGSELLDALERMHFREDLTLADRDGAIAHLGISGPAAAAVLAAALPELAPPAEAYASNAATRGALSLLLVRTRRTGAGDLDLLAEGPAEALASLRADLDEALAEAGGCAVHGEAAEALRVEAGRFKEGPDFAGLLPLEAGLWPEAISLEKGCYPGQEVLERQRSQGRLRYEPAGLVFADGAPPVPGDPVVLDGERIGRVGSVSWSPALGALVALAALRPGSLPAGKRLVCRVGDLDRALERRSLPFVGQEA